MGSSPTTPASLKLKTLKNALCKADLRVFLLSKSRFYPVLANFLANNSKKIIFFTFRNVFFKARIKNFFMTELTPGLRINQPQDTALIIFNLPSHNNLR